MEHFCKLADPAGYVASAWDMGEPNWRAWCVDFFKRHFHTLVQRGVEVALARGEDPVEVGQRAEACVAKCHAKFDAFAAAPERFGRVTILTFDAWRDGTLREFGFVDPFIDVKERENEKMLPLLPAVCREIDSLHGREQMRAVVDGVFAGNIHDFGSEATARAFAGKSPDFFAIRKKLAPRPWLIDDLDALLDRWEQGPGYRRMVYFVDNAGSDFLLGALPMMRWMARRGTEVVIAANEVPTLNDMTAADVRRWWPRIVAAEPSFGELPFEIVSTGTAEPLIDLSAVSGELNRAAEGADFVIIEGMGRAVESNLDARFSCDCLKIAMLKIERVAQRLGGKLYDLVCRFEGV